MEVVLVVIVGAAVVVAVVLRASCGIMVVDFQLVSWAGSCALLTYEGEFFLVMQGSVSFTSHTMTVRINSYTAAASIQDDAPSDTTGIRSVKD